MLQINRLDLSTLKHKKKRAYRPFILPEGLYAFDHPTDSQDHTIVMEATIDQQLVGLAVAKTISATGFGQLLSLFVAEPFRRQGIGKALFGFLQEQIHSVDHMRGMGLDYEVDSPSGLAITKILSSFGWMPAAPHLLRFHFDAYAFDAPWIHDLPPLPTDITLFPWNKLNAQDLDTIKYLGDQGRFLPSISPDYNKALIDYPTSLGMRHKDKLIGWSITHRIDPETIRYSSLYLDQFYHHSGYGIRLLIESIKLHKELPIPRAVFELNLKEIDKSWGYFVKKRLKPLADKIEKIHRAFRLF